MISDAAGELEILGSVGTGDVDRPFRDKIVDDEAALIHRGAMVLKLSVSGRCALTTCE